MSRMQIHAPRGASVTKPRSGLSRFVFFLCGVIGILVTFTTVHMGEPVAALIFGVMTVGAFHNAFTKRRELD